MSDFLKDVKPITESVVRLLLLLAPLFLYFTLKKSPPLDSKFPPRITDGILSRFGIPIKFFTARHDFMVAQTKKFSFFSFSITGRNVIGLRHTKENLDIFYSCSQLSLEDGIAIVFGQPPSKPGENTFGEKFLRRIVKALRNDRLESMLPTFLKTTKASFNEFGDSGTIDPFHSSSINGLVYEMMIQIFAGSEFTKDEASLKMVTWCIDSIGDSVTSFNTLFPQIPSISMITKYIGGARFALMVGKVIKSRENSEKKEDLLQDMLDEGEDLIGITSMLLAILFAGVVNVSVTTSYTLIHLAHSPAYRITALKEIQALAAKHCENDQLSLEEKLVFIPLEAWSGLEFLENCLNESIRLHLHGLAWRRNNSDTGIPLPGSEEKEIPPGAFVKCYGKDELDQRKYDWVGMGHGRHPCPGLKLGKVQMSIIVASFIARFDKLEVTDAAGNKLDTLPPLDKNLHASTGGNGIFLKYSVGEAL